MEFKVEGPLLKQSSACVQVLRRLPDWFGIEEELLEYEREIDHLPTFLAKSNGQVVGFLSLKQHFPASAEIFVMAVHPDSHRKGIGRALVEKAEAHARQLGVEYLQVKTLSPSSPDPGYVKTRTFYEALGYRPMEEIIQIWDENNPCLVMIKRI